MKRTTLFAFIGSIVLCAGVSALAPLGGISVGVGVASGAAFVGNIQSVDRLIWTALGNTTNLAARLQGLTRELHAAMVIDLATWRAAGHTASDFDRREHISPGVTGYRRPCAPSPTSHPIPSRSSTRPPETSDRPQCPDGVAGP